LLVFIQWAWSYATYERGARLITGSTYLPGWTAEQTHSSVTKEPHPQEIHTGPLK
jgi:NADH dehydrogenase